jgi:hypothetical protein
MTTPNHQRLVALVRADQKAWLQSKVTPLSSLADVVREIIDQAIENDIRKQS